MLRSLNELKGMWCFKANIDVSNSDCLGDKCMAWRWYDECKCEQTADCNCCDRLRADAECGRRGYCGLAGDKIVE